MKKLTDLLEHVEYQCLQGTTDKEITSVVYDSRKAEPGSLFLCIKGAVSDGHSYAASVAEKGAAVLVVQDEVDVPKDVTVIRVKDSRYAMACIAAAWFDYPAAKLKTIGITGTKGKTTTTYLVKSILENAGHKTGLIGTIETVIGDTRIPSANTTPESYLVQEYFAKMAEAGCDSVVMEVSSQGIKMHRVDGITFDYGIFTNISPDHIGPDEHADFAEYLYCKSRLLNMCRIGLVNRNDSHFEDIIKDADCELYTYGVTEERGGLHGSGESGADFTASDVRYVSQPDFVGTEFDVKGRYEMDVRLGIPGLFNVDNALAAVSVCSFLGLKKECVGHALEHIRVNGRMEIVHTSARCTVLVDYAHNAVSMESLLTTLRQYHPKRLVVVFGCGGNRSKDRRYTMGEIGGRLADLSIVTADNSRYEKVEDIIADIRGSIEKTGGAFLEIPDRREAIEYSISHAMPGDMIAVIGKGHEDYQEINGVRHHFLDREVIEEVVGKLGEEA